MIWLIKQALWQVYTDKYNRLETSETSRQEDNWIRYCFAKKENGLDLMVKISNKLRIDSLI